MRLLHGTVIFMTPSFLGKVANFIVFTLVIGAAYIVVLGVAK